MADKELGNYKVTFSDDDIVKHHTNLWILRWVRRYHPEVFQTAEEEVRRIVSSIDK